MRREFLRRCFPFIFWPHAKGGEAGVALSGGARGGGRGVFHAVLRSCRPEQFGAALHEGRRVSEHGVLHIGYGVRLANIAWEARCELLQLSNACSGTASSSSHFPFWTDRQTTWAYGFSFPGGPPPRISERRVRPPKSHAEALSEMVLAAPRLRRRLERRSSADGRNGWRERFRRRGRRRMIRSPCRWECRCGCEA